MSDVDAVSIRVTSADGLVRIDVGSVTALMTGGQAKALARGIRHHGNRALLQAEQMEDEGCVLDAKKLDL